MPVVNSNVQKQELPNGSTYVVERHYDQDGREVAMLTWTAPEGFDIDATVAARVTAINEQLAADEFEAIVGA